MAQHLIPSAATLRAIKPGDARRRLSDGAGLYLLLFVKGGSHGWRLDYTFQGRRKTLSLGTFPPPASAPPARKPPRPERWSTGAPIRVRLASSRSTLVNRQRQIEKLVDAGLPVPESLEAVAREWYGKHSPS